MTITKRYVISFIRDIAMLCQGLKRARSRWVTITKRKKDLYTVWLSAEAIDLGRPYWILHPVSYHTPEVATTVFKCSWGCRQKASETCRVILQLLINILPSCITLFLYIYYWKKDNWFPFNKNYIPIIPHARGNCKRELSLVLVSVIVPNWWAK